MDGCASRIKALAENLPVCRWPLPPSSRPKPASVGWIGFLPALLCLSLGAFVFLVLRSTGLWVAVEAAMGLTVMALWLLYLNLVGHLACAAPWITAALAIALVFGVGHHILHMAFQALRRGILSVDAAGNSITIERRPIARFYMEPMTMTFRVKDRALLAGLTI